MLCCPDARASATQRLLNGALINAGATVSTSRAPSLRWALAARPGRDILHLHWLEWIVRPGRGDRSGLGHYPRAARLLLVLAVARARRVRIVWTIHNLEPHEARFPRLEHALFARVMSMADTVIAHSRHAASLAAERFGRTDIEVARHGDMALRYPPPRSTPAEVRERLRIPAEAHVFLAFGRVRPYKHTLRLLAAFASLPHPQCRLVIAGRCTEPELQAEIDAAAAADPRVVTFLTWVPDGSVRELHEAADAAVLAYDDIFSSGALMLALACGLPAIAPANSTATEIAPPPIVLPFEPGGLAAALAESVEVHHGPNAAAREAARRHSWDAMAAVVLGASTQAAGEAVAP